MIKNTFLIIMVFGFLAFCSTVSPAQQKAKSKIPEGEAKFTPKQLQEYYLVYKNGDVKYLRKIFNLYLSSLNDAKKTKQDEENQEVEILKKWDASYYKSRFIVLSRDETIMGHKVIMITFPEKPDKVFTALVYGKTESEYRLDELKLADFSEEDIKRMQVRYRVFYEDKKHSL